MENTTDIKQSELPTVIPALTNLRHDLEENYECTTQKYVVKLAVGGGYIYIYYLTLKATPEQTTTWIEEDLACINAKVFSIQLIWEDDF